MSGTPAASRSTVTTAERPGSAAAPSSCGRLRRVSHQSPPAARMAPASNRLRTLTSRRKRMEAAADMARRAVQEPAGRRSSLCHREQARSYNSMTLAKSLKDAKPDKLLPPGLCRHRIAFLVVVDEIEEGFDRLPLELSLLDAHLQGVGTAVAPAALHEEAVPHLAFLIRARSALFVTPGEDLLVRAAGARAGREVRVLDAKETAAASVEAAGEVGHVISREFSGGVQADLVEHAAEVDEGAYLGVGTAETGDGRPF